MPGAEVSASADTPAVLDGAIPAPPSCRLSEVPSLSRKTDLLVLLMDMDECRGIHSGYLSLEEKDRLQKYKSEHFKKRCTVSRSLLRLIAMRLLNLEDPSAVALEQRGCGGVSLEDGSGVHLCLSYSGSLVCLAISRVKVGIDIERIRPLSLPRLERHPLLFPLLPAGASPDPSPLSMLRSWTVFEACCKVQDTSLFDAFSRGLDLSGISYRTYAVCGDYLLSIATAGVLPAMDLRILDGETVFQP